MSYISRLARAIRAATPPELIPPHSDDLFLLYAALAASKGSRVSAADVHNAWTAWMELHDKRHRSMIPFDKLSPRVRSEDQPFVRAIRQAVAAANHSR